MQNCYKSNKVPQELQVEQDDRLSNKHIQTLKFLQEIVAENKQLKASITELEGKFENCAELHEFAENAKAKILEIQQQYLGRADEINAMLLEKHQIEIMKKVEEKVEAEKQWLEEKEKLEAEIAKLKKENTKQKYGLEVCKEHEHQIRMLDLKVAAQAQELQRLIETIKSMKITEENQTSEINRLRSVETKNKSIKDEIAALIQTNKELKFKITRLEKDLTEKETGKTGTINQEEIVITLKNKLAKALKENSVLETKQKEYVHNIDSLKSEISLLRKSLTDSESMRYEMQNQLDDLIKELEMLKKQLSKKDKDTDKENFKEFVLMKREIQQLREDNEFYKSRLKSSKSGGYLPNIKAAVNGSGKGTAVKRLSSDSKQRLVLS